MASIGRIVLKVVRLFQLKLREQYITGARRQHMHVCNEPDQAWYIITSSLQVYTFTNCLP